MKNFLFGGVKLNSAVGDLGLMVLRVFAGLSLAYAHGWGKLPPGEGFVKGVTSLGMPAEMAWLSMMTELFGGVALAAGFATRPVAAAMLINFSAAAFGAHAADPYARKELALLFLSVAFMFLCVGAGRFSIDRLLKK
jgi:putative oxidoreductase